MPRLAITVRAQAPAVRLRLLDSARGDVARLLQDDAVDMALERPLEVPDWISSLTLFHSPFVVIAAAEHQQLRLAEEGQLFPIELYCTLPHAIRSIDGSLSGMVDDALAAAGRKRQVSLALPHFYAVALAVAQSEYIAAVPSQFAMAVKEALRLRVFQPPLSVPVPEVKLYWHARHDGEAAHHWLRNQVVETVRGLRFDQPA